MSTKCFRISFSFAGEKRDFVAQVAGILAGRFGKDKSSTISSTRRSSLTLISPSIFQSFTTMKTDLIVAIFCPDYPNKEWCGLEWRAIFDLIKKGRVKEVMLTRSTMLKARDSTRWRATSTCNMRRQNPPPPSS